MPEIFVTSYFVTYCIYIAGRPGFCFHYDCAVCDECKQLDAFWLGDRIRLFVHYTISLLSLCKLIWRHWTYKMPVRYILSSVWVRSSIFSQLSIIKYMGLCVVSLLISLVIIERIYTLSCYHYQIGSMNYYPLFRVKSWNNGMRCMSLYIPILIGNSSHFTVYYIQPKTDLDALTRRGYSSPSNGHPLACSGWVSDTVILI